MPSLSEILNDPISRDWVGVTVSVCVAVRVGVMVAGEGRVGVAEGLGDGLGIQAHMKTVRIVILKRNFGSPQISGRG